MELFFEPGVDKLLIQAQLGLELYLYNLFWGVWYRKVGFRFFKLKDWSYIEGLGNYILGEIYQTITTNYLMFML